MTIKPLSGNGGRWEEFVKNMAHKSEEQEVKPSRELPESVGIVDSSSVTGIADSMDEQILSSSESENGNSSVEIMSSESEMPPPLRVWRVKKEIKVDPETVIDNVDNATARDKSYDCDTSQGRFNFKMLHRTRKCSRS